MNFSPLGLLFGSYSVNFEHLMNSQHGLIAEGLFSQSSDKDSTTMSAGAAVGYRWHWSKTQDSGFLGAMLGYQTGTSVVKVVDGAGEKSFDVSVSAPSVTFNVGRRWAWSNGLNITLRFGVGRAVYSLSSTSTDPDVQDAINTVDDLMNALPVTLDGELSIGWIF
ncbi:MAG: hypothetical protein KC502_15065 [Myxococcales bacterium]|nr:hypothetical protein [Myxococcales bacterium]